MMLFIGKLLLCWIGIGLATQLFVKLLYKGRAIDELRAWVWSGIFGPITTLIFIIGLFEKP